MNPPIPFTSRLVLTLLLMLLVPTGALRAAAFDDSKVLHITYPAWFKSGFLDLREDLDHALAGGKTGLMVLFTTEGCSYCDLFIQRSLGDPELASRVRANFDSVGLEIFDDAEMTDPRGAPMRVKEFAGQEGAEFSPTLLFYGKGGERLLRLVGYQSPERFQMVLDYLIEGHFRSESFRDFVLRAAADKQPTHTGDGVRSDPLFMHPPYALDRSRIPAERPLMVFFAEPDCGACAEFHANVLALPEVRAELTKFDVVQLNAGDAATPVLAPDGSRTTPADWYRETGLSRLPGLLFFDERGNEVLRTDALVLRQRLTNSLGFVLERAYEKGWTYQRFARTKAMERRRSTQ